MEVLLLGTGAADGWPNPWCTCAGCCWGRAAGAVRANTAALLDSRLLVDCGPDVPRQADRAGVGLAAVQSILLTHGHWDHSGPAALLTRSWAGRTEPLQLLGPPRALDGCRDWIGPDDPVRLHVLEPGQERLVAGYLVRPLAAAHGGRGDPVGDEALLYDITAPDGARLLYATDTGPLPTDTLQAVTGAAYDVVLLDETFGTVADHGTGHLDLTTFPQVLAELRSRGAVVDRTEVVAVHLGHNNPPGPELDRRLAAWGARTVPDLTRLTVPSGPGSESGSESDSGGVVPMELTQGDLHPNQPVRRELVLGGARSGKSRYAEGRLAAEPRVSYVATGGSREDDAEWATRIATHRARRPPAWHTVETSDVPAVVRDAPPDSAVLVDCLTLWLTTVLDEAAGWTTDGSDDAHDTAIVELRIAELVEAIRATRARVVLVSNEVGSGVVPVYRSGRLFRDLLGELNTRVAAVCDEVTLVVAGRPLRLVAPAP